MSLLSNITGIDIKVDHGRIVRFKLESRVREAFLAWLLELLTSSGVDKAAALGAVANARARVTR